MTLFQLQLILTSILPQHPVMVQYMANGLPRHLTVNRRLLHLQSQSTHLNFKPSKEITEIFNIKMSPVTWIVGSRGLNGKPMEFYQRYFIL